MPLAYLAFASYGIVADVPDRCPARRGDFLTIINAGPVAESVALSDSEGGNGVCFPVISITDYAID